MGRTIDIRDSEVEEVITEIIFSDECSSLRLDFDDDILVEIIHLDPHNLSNFILALQKAKELGWGT